MNFLFCYLLNIVPQFLPSARVLEGPQSFEVSSDLEAVPPTLPGLDAALASIRNTPSTILRLLPSSQEFSVEIATTVEFQLTIEGNNMMVRFGKTIKIAQSANLLILRGNFRAKNSLDHIFEIFGRVIIENSNIENSPAIFAVLGGSLALTAVSFAGNSAAGISLMSGNSNMNISKCDISQHTGSFVLALPSIPIAGTLDLIIDQTTFKQNNVRGEESLIQIENINLKGSVTVTNSCFYDNLISLFIFDIRDFTVSLCDSQFSNNDQTGIRISAITTTVRVQACTWTLNGEITFDIRQFAGQFTVFNSTISQQRRKGVVRILNNLDPIGCSFTLSNSAISDTSFAVATETPGVIAASLCLVFVSNSSMKHIQMTSTKFDYLEGLVVVKLGALMMNNFSLDSAGTSGILIVVRLSNIDIHNSTIINPSSGDKLYISGEGGKVNITDIFVTDGWSIETNRESVFFFNPFFFGFLGAQIFIKNVVLRPYILVKGEVIAFGFGYSDFIVDGINIQDMSFDVLIGLTSSKGTIVNANIKNCVFLLFMIQMLSASSLTFSNATIEDTSVYWPLRGYFCLSMYTTLFTENIYFRNATATMLFAAKMSVLEAKNMTVTKSDFLTLLHFPFQSNIIFEKVSFSESRGGIVSGVNSNVTIIDSVFTDIVLNDRSTLIQSVVYYGINLQYFSGFSLNFHDFIVGGTNSNITFERTILRSVYNEVNFGEFYERSIFVLLNSSWNSFGSRQELCFLAEESTIRISDSTFTAFNVTMLQAHASSVSIKKSLFRDGRSSVQSGASRAAYGSILGCVDCEKVDLEEVRAWNMTARIGGAVAIRKKSSAEVTVVWMTRSSFVMCNAEIGGAVYVQNASLTVDSCNFTGNSARNAGGAIHLDIRQIDKSLIANSMFTRNNATEGGAIKCKNAQARLIHATFFDNSARYGPNIASYGVEISSNLTTFQTNAVSGSPLSLVFELLDHYGQRVTSASNKNLRLLTTDAISFRGNEDQLIRDGIFNFSEVTIYSAPNSSQVISAEMKDVQGDFILTLLGSVRIEFRDCESGEVRKVDRCERCNPGNVSFSPSDTECKYCPKNAFCSGGNTLLVNPHYWRRAWNSTTIMRCPLEDKCLGGNSHLCSNGYTGLLCNECEPHFYRFRALECESCGSSAVLWVEISVVLGVLFAFAFYVRKYIRESDTKLFIVKMMVNHGQMLSMLCWVKVPMPTIMRSGLHAITYVSTLLVTDLPLRCFSVPHPEFVRAAIGSALLLSLSLLFFIAAWCFRSRNFIRELITLCTSALLFTPFAAASSVVPLLACQSVDSSEQWLFVDMSEQCWYGLHWGMVKFIALPSLVFNVLVPIALVSVVSILYPESFRRYFPMWRCGYNWPCWDTFTLAIKILSIVLLIDSNTADKLSQITYGLLVLIVLCVVNVTFVHSAYVSDKLFFLAEISMLVVAISMGLCSFYIYYLPSDRVTDYFVCSLFLALNLGFFIASVYLLYFPLNNGESLQPDHAQFSHNQLQISAILVPNNSVQGVQVS